MNPPMSNARPTLAGTQAGIGSQMKGTAPVSQNTIETDAIEVGRHIKQGGWRLGLLVARSVEKGAGQFRRGSRLHDRGDEKVSLNRFADMAGTSDNRVSRYFDAWEKAAADGLVPPAAELSPGQELDLDFDGMNWNAYYTGAAGPFRIKDESRREALIRQAEQDNVGPGKVQEIAANPNALVAAIKADPKTAQAAAAALKYAAPDVREGAARGLVGSLDARERLTIRNDLDRASRESELSMRGARATERNDAERKSRGDLRAIAADADLIGAKRRIRSALNEVHEADLTDEDRDLLRERVGEIARMLDVLKAELDGANVDWDAELASLMGGE